MEQNLPKPAQNFLKLPRIAKICPNFEIPPKSEILVFFKKTLPSVEGAPKHVHTVWIFIPS
jgi:hypothetical protein